jgi:hypothetical protein
MTRQCGPRFRLGVIMLKSLKVYGLLQATTDLIEQGVPAFEAARCLVPAFGRVD